MDYLPLLYARAARSGGPCVPFWGPDLRRQVAICSGVKEGRAGAARLSPGWAPVHLMGRSCGRARTRMESCMPQLVLPGSLERWAMCPMFGALGAWDGTARHRLFHVAQQRPGWGRIDLAVTKAKPRKVERCSVKNADSKFPTMDRRFARIAGRRLRAVPCRRPRALVLPLPRA